MLDEAERLAAGFGNGVPADRVSEARRRRKDIRRIVR
jgi:hypothetical protein